MHETTKLNLYVDPQQLDKLRVLAKKRGKTPEQYANEAIYKYLAIINPFAEDIEPPQDQTEILFYIPDAAAADITAEIEMLGLNIDLDEYARELLLSHVSYPTAAERAEMQEKAEAAYLDSDETNPDLLSDPLDPLAE